MPTPSPRPLAPLTLVACLVYGLFYLAIARLAADVEATCGVPALDLRGYWTGADAAQLWEACGPTGRDTYLRMAAADLVFPAVGGAALALLAGWLWRQLGRRPRTVVIVPALLMVAFDYIENATVWALLLGGPDLPPPVAAIGGVATVAKLAFGAAAMVFALVLGAAAVTRWRRGAVPVP